MRYLIIWALLCFVATGAPLWAQDLTYGFTANSNAFYSLESDTLSNLATTGNLGGALDDLKVGASGSATANFSYKLKGEGYKLGIDANASAHGTIIDSPFLSHNSYSRFDVTTSWKDALHLYGSGTVPFGTLNANWKVDGVFRALFRIVVDSLRAGSSCGILGWCSDRGSG